MPELPEVETTVRDLNRKIIGRKIQNVWTDFQKMTRLRSSFGGQVKKPKSFEQFKKELKGKKIQKIWRRGKNIIFELSQGYSLLIHQKLTGHLLYGEWEKKQGKWISKGPESLKEKINTYIHLMFSLDNGKMLALSDLRKFGKAELWKTKELKNSEDFKNLGPEPLEKSFTFEKFKQVLKNKKGKIKQVLMNQEVIAGIGNIYSDEILWEVKVHPFKDVSKLKEEELKRLYRAIPKILKKAIELRGESFSDYRDLEGQKGGFDKMRKVYRKEGKKCFRCGTIIQRKKIGGRSAHFCPKCQKL